MDAQRPWPHFVQLNGLPDQMPEVAKDRERLEVSLPSSKCFAEAHASSTWAVSSAMPAQPSLGSVTSSLLRVFYTCATNLGRSRFSENFLGLENVAVDNREAEA